MMLRLTPRLLLRLRVLLLGLRVLPSLLLPQEVVVATAAGLLADAEPEGAPPVPRHLPILAL